MSRKGIWSKAFTGLFGILLATSLTACGGSTTQEPAAPTTTEPQKTETAAPAPAEPAKTFKIGVTQIVEHPALDAARKGFVDYLNENGFKEGEQVTYDFQSAQGSQDTAMTISQKFVADKVDMILAIATPTAQSAAQATKDIPILITAVTDPVSAKIVASSEKPGANVTGTSDMNPIKEQLELIKEVVPTAKKVGVLYNSGEANSVVQVDIAKSIAPDLGLELVERAVTNSSEVKQAAESFSGIDAIYVPGDNTVVSAIDTVLMVGEQTKIPVFAAEGESVKNGALMTYGLDYYHLGRQTGEMAVKILKGEAKPGDMPIETQKDLQLILNLKAAERFGVEIPASVLERANEKIDK
ncbi:ABC transporter substrate-binding protein [Ammoniphilus sp. CFH 90114]|uniref:ABC transporter substrate-binding protein n=1 Tax=Ammoniphilus sp. CFH 90114 TaxID=2493665 RepID=UPI00100FADD4|nr:ABC transporter substrate-binding protein [Ammoniphilus sp. CFH 90114]RXT06511.1 ABC transporter substrate-binding protein [Ammoniphilus sp. CFH 90114]